MNKNVEYIPNYRLCQEMQMSGEQIDEIEQIGQELFDILQNPENYGEPSEISEKVRDLEFQLQDAWGFKMDSSMHIYQLMITGCECAHLLDNKALGGRRSEGGMLIKGDFWADPECPFHGNRSH